jgi:hypothetical protein
MPVAVNSQLVKDERNLQRLILKCKARLSKNNVDTWSGSDRSKFVQVRNSAQYACVDACAQVDTKCVLSTVCEICKEYVGASGKEKRKVCTRLFRQVDASLSDPT